MEEAAPNGEAGARPGGNPLPVENWGQADEEEWPVETACYLCYAQCVNYGVHGKQGRPCAKGVADYIEQRRRLRKVRREALSEQQRSISDTGRKV